MTWVICQGYGPAPGTGGGGGALVTGPETAVAALLTADATIAQLIAARLYPNQGPEDAVFPYVVYHQASRVNVKTFGGPLKLSRYSMGLDCYGSSYASAKAVAGAVCNVLDGFRGTAGSNPSIAIRGTFQEDEGDDYDPPQHGEERGPDVVRVTVDLWYRAP